MMSVGGVSARVTYVLHVAGLGEEGGGRFFF